LGPWLSALAVSVVLWAVHPPSPHAYFARTFGFALAADAHDLRVNGHFLIDSAHADYFFRCSETSAEELIDRVGLEAMVEEGWPFHPAHEFLTRVPDPREWIGRRQYFKIGGFLGPLYYMTTNASMTEVFFTQTFIPRTKEIEEILSSMPGSKESR